MNTTAAITQWSAYTIGMGDDGWVASTLAVTTGSQRRMFGVADKAVAASAAALVTVMDLVVAGPTYIITTALPTTGYGVTLTTGGGVVASVAYGGLDHQFGIWRATTTVASATNACILFGLVAQMTS
jgi:hypothetical protein